MRDLRGRFFAKAGALILATLLAAGSVLSYIATIAIWSGYGTAPSYFDDLLCRDTMEGAMYNALYLVTESGSSMSSEYAYRQETMYAGFAYEVYYGAPGDGMLLGSGGSRENADVGLETSMTVETSAPPPSDNALSPDIAGEESTQGDLTVQTDASSAAGYYTVVGRLYQDLPSYGEFALSSRLYHTIHPISSISMFLTVLLGLGAVLSLIFLFCAAGHRAGVEGIVPNWQDRIPLELYFAGDALLLYVTLVMADSAVTSASSSTYGVGYLSGFAACILLAWLICLAALMTIATRLKLGKWWRNSLCYLLLRFLFSCCRRLWQIVGNFFQILPAAWRAVLLVCGILAAQTFLTMVMFLSYNGGPAFLVALVLDLVVIMGTAWLCRQLQQIRDMGASLAAGNLEAKIDTRKMFRDIRVHAENLNAIGTGMTRAVEQRMKSERLKTELITNVSHDIKTPLTSIVNYVDLLEKEDLPEKATEYLAVLDRQSKRLKKLTEDLVEASKASTGNVSVRLTPILVNEIVHQAIGDYDERLTAGKLEVIVTTYEGNLNAMADGRLLWRVLDNLLSNVCKYALAGTRVYIDLSTRDNRVAVSMKNISRDPLNVNADELMERFVRGDTSRHTEGSGLGLNIAKSLMELMGGTFSLSVDGDLFKAELTLRQVPEDFQSSVQPS